MEEKYGEHNGIDLVETPNIRTAQDEFSFSHHHWKEFKRTWASITWKTFYIQSNLTTQSHSEDVMI